MKTRIKQLGQGMTEYIIIVALIAIAAIAIYGLFGETVREQMGIMTEEPKVLAFKCAGISSGPS